MLIRTGVRAALVAGGFTLLREPALLGQAQPTQPTVTVGGVAYGQYLYQFADTAAHQNNFAVTRAYLNVIGRFPAGVLTRVTADVYTSGNSLVYRLKYAYAGYTPQGSPLTFKLGLLHTPWLDWEEALWDYRMQGTMPIERNGYATSADLGAGVDGTWSRDLVSVQVAVVNGEGYGGGAGDQRKDLQARASVRLATSDDMTRVGGLRLTGYAGIGKPTSGGTRNRFIAMVSYRSQHATLAAQIASTRDTVSGATAPPLTPLPSTTGRLISAYGVLKVQGARAALIGRVDVYDPNTATTGDRQTRVIAGASYQVTPQLRVLANLDRVSYQGPLTPAQRAGQAQGLFQMQFTF
jgi:hypothetical protein